MQTDAAWQSLRRALGFVPNRAFTMRAVNDDPLCAKPVVIHDTRISAERCTNAITLPMAILNPILFSFSFHNATPPVLPGATFQRRFTSYLPDLLPHPTTTIQAPSAGGAHQLFHNFPFGNVGNLFNENKSLCNFEQATAHPFCLTLSRSEHKEITYINQSVARKTITISKESQRCKATYIYLDIYIYSSIDMYKHIYCIGLKKQRQDSGNERRRPIRRWFFSIDND